MTPPPPGAPGARTLVPPPYPVAAPPAQGPAQPPGHAPSHSRRRSNLEEEVGYAADEGDGNWIMSYADLMTLLMSFFALMFSFSKVDQKKFDALRSVVAQQFPLPNRLNNWGLGAEIQSFGVNSNDPSSPLQA